MMSNQVQMAALSGAKRAIHGRLLPINTTTVAKIGVSPYAANQKGMAAFSTSEHKHTRPLSPHLTIYKPGVNMVTSVMFRGTGIALGAGLGLASIGMIFAGNPIEHYIEGMSNAGILPLAKFGVAFPLVYHWLGGVRHLVWDHVIGHEVEQVNQSSWAILGASAVIGAGLTFTSFRSNKEDA